MKVIQQILAGFAITFTAGAVLLEIATRTI